MTVRRDREYVHGTDPEEQGRLADLNTLINRASLAAIAPRAGERLIDFGSGLGQFARDFARVAGTPALGIERSDEQRTRAVAFAAEANESTLAEYRAGDAVTPPLRVDEWGTFDVAHARFLLEHVRDPQAVVNAMARAVRPGGRVVLEDDEHSTFQLWPEPPLVTLVWNAYQRTYDRVGADPHVGKRLVQLLSVAGLQPTRIDQLPFGACAGQPTFVPLVRNLGLLFRGAHGAILATGGVSATEFAAALDALEAFARRGDAAFWYTTRWAEAVRT